MTNLCGPSYLDGSLSLPTSLGKNFNTSKLRETNLMAKGANLKQNDVRKGQGSKSTASDQSKVTRRPSSAGGKNGAKKSVKF
jgi:hypothetical protein